MKINVTIKRGELEKLDLVRLAGRAINRIMSELAESSYEEWERLATERLDTARDRYLTALEEPEKVSVGRGKFVYRIVLDTTDPLVSWIEEGLDSFDMKETGSRIVPILHGAGGIGQESGQAFSKPFRGPRAGPRSRGGARAWTGRGRNSPAAIGRRVSDALKLVEVGGKVSVAEPVLPGHKFGVHAGMRKTGAESGVTFRTISAESPADSWIHPGIQAYHLRDEVEAYALSLAETIAERITAGGKP